MVKVLIKKLDSKVKLPIYKNYDLPKKYKKIYEESREIYEIMNNYSIKL